MVIGNGLIAEYFNTYKDADDIVIFASGVSNSKEDSIAAFQREESYLLNVLHTYGDKNLIYFGTTSIYDNELFLLPYVQHKIKMENFIALNFKRYSIFRLPEVVGSKGNKSTIVNFLYDKISNGEPFEVWKNACRRIIDIKNIAEIVTKIIESGEHKNSTVNIVPDNVTKISELVTLFEKVLGCKADFKIVDKGSCYEIDNKTIKISTPKDYNEKLLRKYYLKSRSI